MKNVPIPRRGLPYCSDSWLCCPVTSSSGSSSSSCSSRSGSSGSDSVGSYSFGLDSHQVISCSARRRFSNFSYSTRTRAYISDSSGLDSSDSYSSGSGSNSSGSESVSSKSLTPILIASSPSDFNTSATPGETWIRYSDLRVHRRNSLESILKVKKRSMDVKVAAGAHLRRTPGTSSWNFSDAMRCFSSLSSSFWLISSLLGRWCLRQPSFLFTFVSNSKANSCLCCLYII